MPYNFVILVMPFSVLIIIVGTSDIPRPLDTILYLSVNSYRKDPVTRK